MKHTVTEVTYYNFIPLRSLLWKELNHF